jgi:aspartate/methionine/tyrosine aminotransferase
VTELLALSGGTLDGLGEQRLSYTESRGGRALRESIAATYSSVRPEDVLVMGTPVEGIYLVARALLDPGDEVVVLTPAYDALVNMYEHVVGEGRVKKWHFRARGDGWNLDLDEMRALISPRTKLLVVNFPHNPTGYLPSSEFQNELVSIAQANDLEIFCDEMYFGLVNEDTERIPSFADVSDSAIVLSGLSKTYGLPGLRCGWLVVKDEEQLANLVNWKFYTSICAPVPSEYLATSALRVWEMLRDRNIARCTPARGARHFSRFDGISEWAPSWSQLGKASRRRYGRPWCRSTCRRPGRGRA